MGDMICTYTVGNFTYDCDKDVVIEITHDNCGCGLSWTYKCKDHLTSLNLQDYVDPEFRTQTYDGWQQISRNQLLSIIDALNGDILES
jgi:hypothetical protein